MAATKTERCPGCRADLPKLVGPTPRYIGASPACWTVFSNLLNAGEPPITPAPMNALIGDAYATQHPSTPSEPAIQSVAVHLLTLYGVLVVGVASTKALWIRQRALREKKVSKRGRFRWLTPPSFEGSFTISHTIREPDPEARADKARDYVEQTWSLWSTQYLQTLSD
jgi:Family of unknown function (DUF5946)